MDVPAVEDSGGGNSGGERCCAGVEKRLKREFERRFKNKMNCKGSDFLKQVEELKQCLVVKDREFEKQEKLISELKLKERIGNNVIRDLNADVRGKRDSDADYRRGKSLSRKAQEADQFQQGSWICTAGHTPDIFLWDLTKS